MAVDKIAATTSSNQELGAVVVAKASDPDGIVPEARPVRREIEDQPETVPNTKPIDEETGSGPSSREEATAGTPQRKIEGQPETASDMKHIDEGIASAPSTNEATAGTPEARKGTVRGYGPSWVASAVRAVRPRNEDRPEAAPDTKLLDEGAASGEPSREEATVSLNTLINDEYFIRDLERLKELRSFLIQEAVSIAPSDSDAMEFGALNLLRRNPFPATMGRGRDPKEEEWTQVERHTRILFSLLTPSLRRRFVLGAIPGMLAWLPLFLALIALVALIMAVMAYNVDLLGLRSIGANVLPFYLIWLMSLGAIGSIAFIGMNALSVQEDITFDLTNRRLIIMRIALGALFGLVLTLPFGFQEFVDFCKTIVKGRDLVSANADSAGGQPPTVTVQAAMLVLPFILGFSTSLVILILNRFVDAVQGFFGRRTEAGGASRTEASPPSSARS